MKRNEGVFWVWLADEDAGDCPHWTVAHHVDGCWRLMEDGESLPDDHWLAKPPYLFIGPKISPPPKIPPSQWEPGCVERKLNHLFYLRADPPYVPRNEQIQRSRNLLRMTQDYLTTLEKGAHEHAPTDSEVSQPKKENL